MLVKTLNQGCAQYWQADHVIHFRENYGERPCALHICRYDSAQYKDADGLVFLMRSRSDEREVAVWTDCDTYLMNDDGKTLERLQ